MAMAKMVILHFLYSMVLDKFRRALVTATVGINVIWTFISIFVVAFKCRPPQTWALVDALCIDTVSA